MKKLILVSLMVSFASISAAIAANVEKVVIKAGRTKLNMEMRITSSGGEVLLEKIRVYSEENGLTYFLALEPESENLPLNSICSQLTGGKLKSAAINYQGLRMSVVELQWNLSQRGVVLFGDERGRLVGADFNLAANRDRNERIMALDSIICSK